jgi:hypothetical protein
MLLYNVGFQFSFLIVLFLIRGMEVKPRVKSFLWVEQRLKIHSPLSIRQKIVAIGFDLLYLGGVIFFATLGLQLYYFRLFQPLVFLTATWSGFCASGIMAFSLLKIIFPFAIVNDAVNLFLLPLQSCADFIFTQQLYCYVHHSHFILFVLYYALLLLSLFVRKFWPFFMFVATMWLVIVLYPQESSVRLYYANVKGSHIVVWIKGEGHSAIVYVNGRSTQAALSRLLADQHIDTISELWVGDSYTPIWRIENQYKVRFNGRFHDVVSQTISPGVKWAVKQNKLIIEDTSKSPVSVDLDNILLNQFYRETF